MEEYLAALFPTQMVPESTAATHHSGLDAGVAIDRKFAEKGEITVMGNPKPRLRSRTAVSG